MCWPLRSQQEHNADLTDRRAVASHAGIFFFAGLFESPPEGGPMHPGPTKLKLNVWSAGGVGYSTRL